MRGDRHSASGGIVQRGWTFVEIVLRSTVEGWGGRLLL